MIPLVVLIPGSVSRAGLHISLTLRRRGEVVVLALLAPDDPSNPDEGRVRIEWLIGDESHPEKRLREKVRRGIDFYLLERAEPRPWSYLLHHCNSSANLHSFENGGIGWRRESG